jgi:hypothetical protein
MDFPGGAEQCQRLGRQGNRAVFGALATVDMALEALAVHIRDLQAEGFVEPESQAIDRGEVDLVMPGGSRLQDTVDFLNTEDSGEVRGGLGTQERPRGPVAWEDVLIEETKTTGAEPHGRGGKAIDVFTVEEGAL